MSTPPPPFHPTNSTPSHSSDAVTSLLKQLHCLQLPLDFNIQQKFIEHYYCRSPEDTMIKRCNTCPQGIYSLCRHIRFQSSWNELVILTWHPEFFWPQPVFPAISAPFASTQVLPPSCTIHCHKGTILFFASEPWFLNGLSTLQSPSSKSQKL